MGMSLGNFDQRMHVGDVVGSDSESLFEFRPHSILALKILVLLFLGQTGAKLIQFQLLAQAILYLQARSDCYGSNQQ